MSLASLVKTASLSPTCFTSTSTVDPGKLVTRELAFKESMEGVYNVVIVPKEALEAVAKVA
ncbi:MAG TPA: hypothetical protein VF790_02145 [Dissulfurispiraceae bacterium]